MHTQYAKHFEILLNENCCMHVKYYNGKQKSLKFHLMKPATVWDALLSMNKSFFSNEYLKINSKIYPSVIYSNKKHKIFFSCFKLSSNIHGESFICLNVRNRQEFYKNNVCIIKTF